MLRAAEAPIIRDLGAAGVSVSSVWDLVNTSEPYPDALPVLISHLERGGYPDRVMESVGRALAVKPAVIFWERLRSLYLRAREEGERTGLAVALAASATSAHAAGLLDLVRRPELGESRILLLSALKRARGRQGKECLAEFADDPVLGREARSLLKTRTTRDASGTARSPGTERDG